MVIVGIDEHYSNNLDTDVFTFVIVLITISNQLGNRCLNVQIDVINSIIYNC